MKTIKEEIDILKSNYIKDVPDLKSEHVSTDSVRYSQRLGFHILNFYPDRETVQVKAYGNPFISFFKQNKTFSMSFAVNNIDSNVLIVINNLTSSLYNKIDELKKEKYDQTKLLDNSFGNLEGSMFLNCHYYILTVKWGDHKIKIDSRDIDKLFKGYDDDQKNIFKSILYFKYLLTTKPYKVTYKNNFKISFGLGELYYKIHDEDVEDIKKFKKAYVLICKDNPFKQDSDDSSEDEDDYD